MPIQFSFAVQLDSWFFNSLMDYFDTDGDGTIDKTEWSLLFRTMKSAMPSDAASSVGTEDEWTALFDTIDAGEDGRLRTCDVT